MLLFEVIHPSEMPCRHIVGLAGPPGAGKSTLASEVVQRVNELWPEKASSLDSEVRPPDVAVVLPMDGFHLYRSQLDAMEVSLLIFNLILPVVHIPLYCLWLETLDY